MKEVAALLRRTTNGFVLYGVFTDETAATRALEDLYSVIDNRNSSIYTDFVNQFDIRVFPMDYLSFGVRI